MIKHLLIPLLILTHYCTAQNLVPNGGFEERTGCPQALADLDSVCNDWHSYAGSCDYFNICSSNISNFNPFGYQQPHGGEGYAGMASFSRSHPNAREHLGCELLSPLEVGQTYYISFFVSNAWKRASINIATNRIGFLCSTYAYSIPLGNFDQLPNFTAFGELEILSDTVAWTQIHHSFVADSAYTHLILGNFYDDNNTDTLNQPNLVGPFVAYYYIDDVCLSADSTICPLITSVTDNKMQDASVAFYPNPAGDEITVNPLPGFLSYELTDNLGRYVMGGLCKKTPEKLSLEKLESGMYFLRFYAKNRNFISKITKL